MPSPLIAIPGRFAEVVSVRRYDAVVTARTLLESVTRAGGQLLTVLPQPWAVEPAGDPASAVADLREHLGWADGVLLPGGGDLNPARYGQPLSSGEVYGVDEVQDAFDLAVARWALADGVPLLAICRGAQVVNVALGGSLLQHMDLPHRNLMHEVAISGGVAGEVFGDDVKVPCYHHQRLARLGEGLQVVGRADDGTPEAFDRPGSPGWFLGVQWHPEDVAATVPAHQRAFDALVAAAGSSRRST